MKRTAVPVAVASGMPVQNQRAHAGLPEDAGVPLAMLAHLARVGDVTVGEGDWVGGPAAPAPVEGIAVRCSPNLGALDYQVMAVGEGRWSDWTSAGAFAGSRGRAKALVGVRLRLHAAVDAVIEGEALFLGSVIVRKQGLDLEFRSSAGNDPLVGLRIGIRKNLPATTLKPTGFDGKQGTGRVRVFRASAARRSGF